MKTVEEIAFEISGQLGREVLVVAFDSSIDPTNPRNRITKYDYYYTNNKQAVLAATQSIVKELQKA